MDPATERQFTMPWPPSLNAIWRSVGGRIILAAVSRKYKERAAAALPVGRVPPPMAGRLWVWLTFHPPAKVARQPWDIANREKLLCDVLTQQRVWVDDSQIDVLVLQRGEPTATGHVAVHIVTIPEGHRPL